MRLADELRAALDLGWRGKPDLLPGDVVHEVDGALPAIRAAAVLVAVVDRPEPGVILTVRPETMRRHAGQVAFPGGRVDPGDDGIVGAALREAWEEIALQPEAVEIVGTADPYRTITGFDVTPVIGIVPPDLPLVPDPAEVARIFEAPLATLLDPARHLPRTAMFRGAMRTYYEIDFAGERIWGATAAMIVNLSRRLSLAPPLQGRGWGGDCQQAGRLRTAPTPNPSPKGEGLSR